MTPDARSGEAGARAYCAAIGADPDEIVAGYDALRTGTRERLHRPRWQWFVGADATTANGACGLTPNQFPFAARSRTQPSAPGSDADSPGGAA